jgi:hypothetical protein
MTVVGPARYSNRFHHLMHPANKAHGHSACNAYDPLRHMARRDQAIVKGLSLRASVVKHT